MSEVLIVDDDHNFRETLRELLSDAGYQTCIATNAEKGLALLQTTTPDPLAEYFLARYAQRNQLASTGLSADAIAALQNYSFQAMYGSWST
jgi:DNA-binding NtrC family response regulator